MKIKIVAVGKIKERYYREAVAEYEKRLSRFARTETAEVNECFFDGIPNEKERAHIKETEGVALCAACEGYVVVLERTGKKMTSEQLAHRLEEVKLRRSTVTFVIGGSYGVSEAVKNRADLLLSFGDITLPHQLARVVLTEQIYRAFTISGNINYHK